MLERGAVQILPLGLSDVPRMQALMKKYADRPMDVADAALVALAERENVRVVFTVDRHTSPSTVSTAAQPSRSSPEPPSRVTRLGA